MIILRALMAGTFVAGGPAVAYELPQMVALIERTQWGWSTAENLCVDQVRIFTFNDDMSVMFSEGPEIEGSLTYHVLNHGSNSITMAIEGEDRLTPAGVPVVWELRFGGPDALCWRATHWDLFSCTPFLVRCPEAPVGS